MYVTIIKKPFIGIHWACSTISKYALNMFWSKYVVRFCKFNNINFLYIYEIFSIRYMYNTVGRLCFDTKNIGIQNKRGL